MEKTDYIKAQNEIKARLGEPVYDMGDPVNDSAKELRKLQKAYMSELRKSQVEERKQLLNQVEQKEVTTKYKVSPAIPVDLSEADLEPFTDLERQVLIDYFHNTNLTPTELARSHFSRQKVVALQRSGLFNALCARVFEHLMPLEVRNASLKAVRDGDKKLIERFAEQYGVLKNQELNLNVNKPLDDTPEIIKKLKDLGDVLGQ